MENLQLITVPTANIDEWWPEVLPWAEDFCQYSQGSYTPDYILERLQKSLMQLWLAMDGKNIVAVCLTEIRKTVIKEYVIVVMTGEDMLSWIHMLGDLENYARSLGCQKIVGVARPGWEKILKPIGYRKTHITVEKEL